MTDKTYNVLFLCTGNSARSIMAEALVTTMAKGRFKGFSAGSKPGGKVNPFAIEQVKKTGYPVDDLRSKSWDEFAAPGAPHMDFIITVCDNAAGEVCPFWPGHPATAHWGFEDPAAARAGTACHPTGHQENRGHAGMTLAKRVVSEGLGIAFLLSVVIGSGIMGERLAGGNVAIALLANAIATGAGLVALILMFGTISGAHFNPVVTLSEVWQKNLPANQALPYIAAQVAGAFAGVAAAHLMFGEPLFFASTHARTGLAQWWSEFIATFGLLAVIISCSRSRPSFTPFAVALYITAAYWFTSSTSFANPAVTLARAASNTFAGIRPVDVPGFVIAQLLSAAAATLLFSWLYPAAHADATVAGTVERSSLQ